jgi:hypothetical protein
VKRFRDCESRVLRPGIGQTLSSFGTLEIIKFEIRRRLERCAISLVFLRVFRIGYPEERCLNPAFRRGMAVDMLKRISNKLRID